MFPRDVIGRGVVRTKWMWWTNRGLFFDYRDSRVAFFFDGKLASGVALFPESNPGRTPSFTVSHGRPGR